MNTNTQTGKSPLSFFVLVLILSVPIWLVGGKKLPLPVNLPASALAALVPGIAASVLSFRRDRFAGVRALLSRALDFRRVRNKIWYLPALLLMPLLYVLSYVIMRVTGMPLPDPIQIPWTALPAYFALYFVAGAGEELGWSGYALDPLQKRWGALKAGLLLGIFWAVWHSVTYVQTGNVASWIAWQTARTVAFRVLCVWVYNNTGKSVFATILFHSADNVAWSLFPNNASHYSPMVTGLFTWIVMVTAVFGWGAKTLARCRFGEQQPNTVAHI
jgi:membrane protease YdiL (CAAX protease family)